MQIESRIGENRPNDSSKKSTSGVLKAIKIIAIVCAVLSLVIPALILSARLKLQQPFIATIESDYVMVNTIWYCFLFLPLPLICLIYGIVLTIKKYKAVSNVVIGSIFTFLLVVYGCFSFIFNKDFSTSNDYWNDLSERISINLPNDLKVISASYSDENTFGNDKAIIKFESVARFNSTESLDIFKSEMNANWKDSYVNSTVPSTYMAFKVASANFNKYLIYSVSDNSYNPSSLIPNRRYICIAFTESLKGLYLLDYIATK